MHIPRGRLGPYRVVPPLRWSGEGGKGVRCGMYLVRQGIRGARGLRRGGCDVDSERRCLGGQRQRTVVQRESEDLVHRFYKMNLENVADLGWDFFQVLLVLAR